MGDDRFHHRAVLALFINAAILIVAAATFHPAGSRRRRNRSGARLAVAAARLGHCVDAVRGRAACSGLNSTVTATLSGQIVMEGFLHLRLPRWARRLVTRGIAIVPAIVVTRSMASAAPASFWSSARCVLSCNCRSRSCRWCCSCRPAPRWARLRSPARSPPRHGSWPASSSRSTSSWCGILSADEARWRRHSQRMSSPGSTRRSSIPETSEIDREPRRTGHPVKPGDDGRALILRLAGTSPTASMRSQPEGASRCCGRKRPL